MIRILSPFAPFPLDHYKKYGFQTRRGLVLIFESNLGNLGLWRLLP